MLEETKKKNWIFSSAETWMIYDVALSAYVQTCSGKHYNPSSTTSSSRLKLFCNFLLFQYFSIYILSFFHFSMKFKQAKKKQEIFCEKWLLKLYGFGTPSFSSCYFRMSLQEKNFISHATVHCILFQRLLLGSFFSF